MNDLDPLVGALRAQMLQYTAADSAPPDLLPRVHRAVARRRARIASAGAVLAVGGVAGALVLPGSGVPDRLAGPAVVRPAVGGVAGVSAQAGPDDAATLAAGWWSFCFTDEQAGEPARTVQRWYRRDGRVSGSIDDDDDPQVLSIGAERLDAAGALALPADADRLATRLSTAAEGGRSADVRLFAAAADLLRVAPLTMAVRRSLGEVLVGVPGAAVQRDVVDSRGRTALRVRLTDDEAVTRELYLDPVTWRLIEERRVTAPGYPAPPDWGLVPSAAPVPAGQVLYLSTYFGWGTTAPGKGDRPPAPPVPDGLPAPSWAPGPAAQE